MKGINARLAAITGSVALLCVASQASAQVAPSLGSAQSFAVLAGSAVTNTGSSIVTGDLGVSPGTAISGFPPGLVVSGTTHSADAVALAAENSTTTAYNNLASQACTQDLTGQDLGGKTLTPGVYCFSSSAQLTGTLTLDAQGNAGAVFIFQIGSTLTTASGSSVVSVDGGTLCNIFWQIGSSATLGTGTAFAGNILALTSITLTTGATVNGRTLARNGAVTLDSNGLTPTCLVSSPPPVCPVITLAPATLIGGTVAVAYNQTIDGNGGAAPYTFARISGTLPTGLTLKPSGVLSGTPTGSGTFNFVIRGTDANGCSANISYSIIIAPATAPPPVCPTITVSPTTLPGGTVAVAYSQTITASGGVAPYNFGVTAGTLPAGLVLTAAGVLSGTPTVASSYPFTIRGTDANACFATRAYTVLIVAAVVPPPQCPTITLAPTSLPSPTVGVDYSRTITASGGTGPYSFGITAGALPAGLTLTSGGLLSGRPTTGGTSTFTIRATAADGCFGELAFTISAPAAVPTLPEVFVVLLALGLLGIGFLQLRRKTHVA